MARVSTCLALTLLFGCSEPELRRSAPRLDLSAYVTDQSYAEVDDLEHRIDLGQVPVYATKWAIWEAKNDTQHTLHVAEVSYDDEVGRRWDGARLVDPDTVEPDRPFRTGGVELPATIPPFSTYLLGVPYSPIEIGEHSVKAVIESDAVNNEADDRYQFAYVDATSVFTGEPDLEVEYNAYRGPDPEQDCVDIDTDGIIDGCAIHPNDAMRFGNIGLGGTGTVRLIVRNTAECTPFDGVDACTLCSLDVTTLTFKPGTNDEGYFSFAGTTATPLEIRQRNVTPECDESGEKRILVNFDAPNVEGEYTATILVESNDPNEPSVEIPLRAAARNAPVAVAKFREEDPTNPGAPWTDPDEIEPLERVYFDGRESYDPAEPTNPARIATYQWTVLEFPTGANPDDFQQQGQNSSLYSFWLPIAGHYVVGLKVWNTDGIESGDTESSRLEFDVVPGDALHIQLVWDNATNDQDLHLTFVDQDDRICNIPWDCHYHNREPQWFAGWETGVGPNPRLDIDDTNGLGPENINVDEPEPGVYRVYVHAFEDWTGAGFAPTRDTVRIYVNGMQVAEYRRTLSAKKQIWAVADIVWQADGTGTVSPYPSDESGQIGAVSSIDSCESPGWVFQ